MTTPSEIRKMTPKEREEYGYARAKDLAFDAVMGLMRRREAAGAKRSEIAKSIAWSPSRLSRTCRGPGNWTMLTLGALVEALDGELEITVHGMEDQVSPKPNYHAYEDRGVQDFGTPPPKGLEKATQVAE